MQKEILDTLTGLKSEVNHMKQDLHKIIEHLQDSSLTESEKVLVGETISKIKSGDESDLISHENLKKDLGL